jgi:hypothetical protein
VNFFYSRYTFLQKPLWENIYLIYRARIYNKILCRCYGKKQVLDMSEGCAHEADVHFLKGWHLIHVSGSGAPPVKMSRGDSATHLSGVFEEDEMHNSLVPEAERREVNNFASNPAFISEEEEAPSQHQRTHGDRSRGDFNARHKSDLVASNLVVQLPPPARSRNFSCDPEASTSSAMDRPSHLHYFLTKAPSLVDMTRFDLISLNKPLFESLITPSSNSSSLLEPPPHDIQAAGPSNEDLAKSFSSIEKDFYEQSIRTEVTSMASSDLQTSSSEDDDVVTPDVIPRFVRPSMRRIKRIRLPLALDDTADEPLPPPINFATINDEINSTMTTDLEDSFLDSSSIAEDDVLRRNVLDSSIESNLSSASTVQYSETR